MPLLLALAACAPAPPTAPASPPPDVPAAAAPTPTVTAPEDDAPPGAAAEAPPAPRVHASPVALHVRRAPDRRAPRRGLIAPHTPFEVLGLVAEGGEGCTQWGRLVRDGFACLDGTTVREGATPSPPPLLPFDPPTPEEAGAYRSSNTWPRDTEAPEAFLPFAYGRKRAGAPGRFYEPAGDAPDGDLVACGRMDPIRAYRFTDVVETPDGARLVRPDGEQVPIDELHVHPVSRFVGLGLEALPAPDRAVPAWVFARDGVAVRGAPDPAADTAWTAPHHAALAWHAPGEDGWVRVTDPRGEHPPGWLPEDAPVRRWIPAPPPDGVGDAVWVDVEVDQQILAVRRGERLVHATLVSTGRRGDDTPLGLYRVGDKLGWWDMASRPGSSDAYHVEAVPWVAHFFPRYALHGAFWHDDFGSVRSHGCVNLAPKDAAIVFDALEPSLPPGWWGIWETPDDPGSVLRVRDGARVDVPDRRKPLE